MPRPRTHAFYGGQRPVLDFTAPEEDKGPKRRPAPATPILLPLYTITPLKQSEVKTITADALRSIFVCSYPSKWKHAHHRLLGIELNNNTDIDALVPSKYVPAKQWEEKYTPSQTERHDSDSSQSLSNGAAVPSHEAFYNRVVELKHERDDVINAIVRRKQTPGRTNPRVTHFRKFWQSYEQVGRYWDTSKDGWTPAHACAPTQPGEADQEPIPPHTADPSLGVSPKSSTSLSQTMNSASSLSSSLSSSSSSSQVKGSALPPQVDRQRAFNLAVGAAPSNSTTNTSSDVMPGIPSPSSDTTTSIKQEADDLSDQNKQVAGVAGGPTFDQTMKRPIKDYYGYRTSAGKEMSNQYRTELIVNFINPIVHAMGCHFESNRAGDTDRLDIKRFVTIGNGRIRQQVSGFIYRGPADQRLARQGWNEGPLLAISCRPGTEHSRPVAIGSPEGKEITNDLPESLRSNLGCPTDEQEEELHEKGIFITDDGEPSIVRWTNFDIIDSSRELGALLMAAQFRARNARTENEPIAGQEQWWAHAQRYGGHPNKGEEVGKPLVRDDGTAVDITEDVEMMTADENDDDSGRSTSISTTQEAAHSVSASPRTDHANSSSSSSSSSSVNREQSLSHELSSTANKSQQERHRREHEIAQRKRELRWQPPKPCWDTKTHYMAVGNGPEQQARELGRDFELVYCISSVYRHVSVLRLRIHRSMLEFIGRGEAGGAPRPRAQEYGMYVSRSRWFDLFEVGDRVEAMRCIWGVMAYMMRDTSGVPGEEETTFADMLAKAGKLAAVG